MTESVYSAKALRDLERLTDLLLETDPVLVLALRHQRETGYPQLP